MLELKATVEITHTFQFVVEKQRARDSKGLGFGDSLALVLNFAGSEFVVCPVIPLIFYPYSIPTPKTQRRMKGHEWKVSRKERESSLTDSDFDSFCFPPRKVPGCSASY